MEYCQKLIGAYNLGKLKSHIIRENTFLFNRILDESIYSYFQAMKKQCEKNSKVLRLTKDELNKMSLVEKIAFNLASFLERT